MELLIVSIICGLLLAISLGKPVYWKGQAKFYKMMRDAAMDHADTLSDRIIKQSKYIEELRAELDAATLHACARENFVSVSDSAHVSPEYPPKYPDGHHYIHTWDGNKVKVGETHEGENHE